jgi:membrane-bound metal-dependent hydrolase YbcI (DUF457 family)
MDIISHGLWGSIAFGRKNKKSFWTTFLIGIAPDMLSFGLFFAAVILGIYPSPDFRAGPPPTAMIPNYISSIYNVTHSLIIFALVFFIVWLISKKPYLPLFAWGLHVFIDIFTHSYEFFPTPFIWPISSYKFNGTNWGEPIIFIPNLLLLAILYGWFFLKRRNRKNIATIK